MVLFNLVYFTMTMLIVKVSALHFFLYSLQSYYFFFLVLFALCQCHFCIVKLVLFCLWTNINVNIGSCTFVHLKWTLRFFFAMFSLLFILLLLVYVFNLSHSSCVISETEAFIIIVTDVIRMVNCCKHCPLYHWPNNNRNKIFWRRYLILLVLSSLVLSRNPCH